MQIFSYKLDALLTFDKDSIENFLVICEEVINKITDNENAKFKLKSAAHELLVNSLEHGYQKGSGRISFSLERIENKVLLEIIDEGKGFDVENINMDIQSMTLDSIKGRGWGLIIIYRLFENMEIIKNSPNGTKVTATLIL